MDHQATTPVKSETIKKFSYANATSGNNPSNAPVATFKQHQQLGKPATKPEV